jgi:hypothetical protein
MANIIVKSNLTPDLSLDIGKKGGSSKILSFLKPQVMTSLPYFGKVEYAPFGQPTDGNKNFKLVLIGIGIIFILTFFGIVYILKHPKSALSLLFLLLLFPIIPPLP